MGLRVGAYLKVWKIERFEKYTKVQGSTSRKNKETDTYETDWNGFLNFAGQAHTEIAKYKENDRVKIEEFEVKNKYDKEKKQTSTYYSVFKISDANNNATQPAAEKAPDAPVQGAADDLPF